MAKIAIFPFPAPGHIFGTKKLIKELESRGHWVVIFTVEDGLKYFASDFKNIKIFAQKKLPLGSLKRIAGRTTKASGFRAFTSGLKYLRLINTEILNVNVLDFDIVLQDELFIRVPIQSGKNAIYSSSITSRPDQKGICLPLVGNRSFLTKAFFNFINLFTPGHLTKETLHLNCYTRSLISVKNPTQQDVFTGPWIDGPNSSCLLNKKKLIYVSLGTLVDNLRKVTILTQVRDVCEELQITTIISWGDNKDLPSEFKRTAFVEVIPFANQMEILKEASLMINHGGINSVQECALTLTPMICLPLKHDQPYVSMRVHTIGIGSYLDYRSPDFRGALKELIIKELNLDRSSALQSLREEIMNSGGLKKAAMSIENLL